MVVGIRAVWRLGCVNMHVTCAALIISSDRVGFSKCGRVRIASFGSTSLLHFEFWLDFHNLLQTVGPEYRRRGYTPNSKGTHLEEVWHGGGTPTLTTTITGAFESLSSHTRELSSTTSLSSPSKSNHLNRLYVFILFRLLYL